MSISEVGASAASFQVTQPVSKSVKAAPEISSQIGAVGEGASSVNVSSTTCDSQTSQETVTGTRVLEVMQKMHTDPGYKPTLQEQKAIENIKKINEELVGANRELQISIHDETKRIIAKVVDTDTKEVIKEIPSEKLLDMFYCMMEYSGLLVDEKR